MGTLQFQCSFDVGHLGSYEIDLSSKLVPSSVFLQRVVRGLEQEISTSEAQEITKEMIVEKMRPQARLWMRCV